MNKKPNFVEVRNAGARTGSNFMGYTSGGILSIHAGFHDRVKSFTHCIFLVDSRQNLIGVQFGGEELGDGAYRINHSKDNKTAWVASSNIFKIEGMNVNDWFGKWVPEQYDDCQRKNVFVLDLEMKIASKRKKTY